MSKKSAYQAASTRGPTAKKAAAKGQTVKKAAAKKAAANRADAPKDTIRGVVVSALTAGATNAQALAAVRKAFPSAKTSEGSIRWYRAKLKEDRPKIRGSREAARRQAAAGPREAAKDIFE